MRCAGISVAEGKGSTGPKYSSDDWQIKKNRSSILLAVVRPEESCSFWPAEAGRCHRSRLSLRMDVRFYSSNRLAQKTIGKYWRAISFKNDKTSSKKDLKPPYEADLPPNRLRLSLLYGPSLTRNCKGHWAVAGVGLLVSQICDCLEVDKEFCFS